MAAYDKFEQLLTYRKIRTSDVCSATGISAPTFSDWKRGKSCPKTDKLIKIANFFGVSVEYFFEIAKAQEVTTNETNH